MNKDDIKDLVEDMSNKVGMFAGKYDASHNKNGVSEYMQGIQIVMEYLAYNVSDDYGDKFSEMFIQNMIDSEKKVEDNTEELDINIDHKKIPVELEVVKIRRA